MAMHDPFREELRRVLRFVRGAGIRLEHALIDVETVFREEVPPTSPPDTGVTLGGPHA